MAPAPTDPNQHRRTQRRRAWIGWVGGLLVIALVVAAGIAGGDSHRDSTTGDEGAGLFDYHLSSRQFTRLKLGESESAVVDRLGKVGLPEGLTNIAVVGLFPLHEEEVNCSYWEISDAVATVVRLCFSSPEGALVDKRERDLSGEFEGGGSTV